MINLVSPQSKKELKAARGNRVVRNYYLIVLFAAVLLGCIFAVGFYVTITATKQAEAQKAQNAQNAAVYAQTRKAAEDFTKDLAVAKTILASDVRFSKLITDIASVIPPGVILTNLTFAATQNQNAPLTINARAKTFDAAIKLKNNLEASPIFENVRLINASDDASGSTYPVAVSLSVQFTKAKVGS